MSSSTPSKMNSFINIILQYHGKKLDLKVENIPYLEKHYEKFKQ